MNHPCPARMLAVRHRGFTLIELIVVISIIMIVVAAVVPLLGAMGRMVRGGAGANTVNVAVTAARAYSVRNRDAAFLESGLLPHQNQGVAILFTPANELRLIESVPSSALQGRGFADIAARDYIKVPNSNVVYGITRESTGELRLIAPPFAIRFDGTGQLVAGRNISGEDIVYDGRGDGSFDPAVDRDNPYPTFGGFYDLEYTPDAWNPRHNAAVPRVSVTGGYVLPFNSMEAVIGVVVMSTVDFQNEWRRAGRAFSPGILLDPAAPAEVELLNWVFENGEFMFFSRYTGTYLRERRTR